MATRIITGTILDADDDPVVGQRVSFVLTDGTYLLDPDVSYMASGVTAITDSQGAFSVALASGLPLFWNVALPNGETFVITVPTGATTTLEALRAESTGLVPERLVGDPPTVTDFTNATHDHLDVVGGGLLPYAGPVFSVKAYGAVGDDSTDDTSAFLATIAAVVANGGTLYIPPGRYRITEDLPITLVTSNHHIEIAGQGKYQSILRFTGIGVAGGVTFWSTGASDYLHPTFHVHDLGIITSKKDAGTALSISWHNDTSTDETYLIENVVIAKDITRVSDSGADYGYWSEGISITNGRNGAIRNCFIQGDTLLSPNSTHGIHLQGECTASVLTDNQVTAFTYGLLVEDMTEGIYAFANDFLYGDYGIHINVDAGEPQMTIIGNSFNAKVYGVRLTNCMTSIVSGNLFYSWAGYGAAVDWAGVRVDGTDSRQVNITDNSINREPTTTGVTTIGVDLAAGTGINVTNNHLFAYNTHVMTTGVKVGAAVTSARLRNNQTTNVTTEVSDAGTNTQIEYWASAGPKFAGSANQELTVSGSSASFLKMEDTGGGVNDKYVAMVNDGGSWSLWLLNDDGSLKSVPLSITNGQVATFGGNVVLSGNNLNMATQNTPASAAATGTKGDIRHDSSFIYVCTATNTWKRVAIATW